ncbi:hypothetical protein [Streptomyces sp. G-5]|uniref:hypothetical protein n=1 Tax=Streptomyces sp. G-5 TaxID=2977231 RepID=UPI0021CE1391|nr:hypothetical protein [Streptomyces sp. G-5]MCU4750213.1 hypothetical protein [Streptomyces sp. G-5]
MYDTDQWFATHVVCDELGPYPAEVRTMRWNGFLRPRFRRDVVERIVADTANRDTTTPDGYPTVSLAGDTAEVRTFGAASELEEACRPEGGWYHLGAGYWPWEEHITQETYIYAAWRQGARPLRAAPGGTWTVVFQDNGHWMAVLDVFPAQQRLDQQELVAVLFTEALGSYVVPADTPQDAEEAARRHFAAERADVLPDAVTRPHAWPSVRIAGL